MHFPAAVLVMNLVHELLHQKNSAPVLGIHVFRRQRIGNRAWIESRAFITHNERHTKIVAAIAPDVNFFSGIFTVAVNHRVRQSLAQRELNSKLTARIAVVS